LTLSLNAEWRYEHRTAFRTCPCSGVRVMIAHAEDEGGLGRLASIPDELRQLLLEHLSLPSLGRLMQTSRALRALCASSAAWQLGYDALDPLNGLHQLVVQPSTGVLEPETVAWLEANDPRLQAGFVSATPVARFRGLLTYLQAAARNARRVHDVDGGSICAPSGYTCEQMKSEDGEPFTSFWSELGRPDDAMEEERAWGSVVALESAHPARFELLVSMSQLHLAFDCCRHCARSLTEHGSGGLSPYYAALACAATGLRRAAQSQNDDGGVGWMDSGLGHYVWGDHAPYSLEHKFNSESGLSRDSESYEDYAGHSPFALSGAVCRFKHLALGSDDHLRALVSGCRGLQGLNESLFGRALVNSVCLLPTDQQLAALLLAAPGPRNVSCVPDRELRAGPHGRWP
jgi:hypothetical protein